MDASSSGSSVAEAIGKAFRLNTDRDRHGQEAFSASPFSRLLITHVLSLGGDALVTLALAGSIFFDTNPDAARGRAALTLLLTIAPFAVVAPLLGPMVDKAKGGRRAMVVATAIGRAVACLLMARYINSYFLFPAALLALVCSKGYVVAKATLVPAVVQRPQDLVEANSKLAVSGAIAGFIMAIPGVAILKLASAAWVLRVDIVVYLVCAATALRLHAGTGQARNTGPATGREGGPGRRGHDTEVLGRDGVSPGPAPFPPLQAKPLPAGAIQVAAFAMGTLRSIVGFLTFVVVFAFRDQKAPAWWYGVVLAASIGGNLVGAAVAPWLRFRIREELILAGSAVTVAIAGILAVFLNAFQGRPAAALLAAVVGLAAGGAKLAFDALVQRHVPAAIQGRAFGRFEAGFQLVWVLGGLAPVVIVMSLTSGFLIVGLAAGFAAGVYVVGTRMARLGRLPDWWPGVRPARSRRPRGAETRPQPSPGPPSPSSGATPAGAAHPRGAEVTVPFGPAPPTPDEVAVPRGRAAPWIPTPEPPTDEDRPWLDPLPDFGIYPPLIPGPPPLSRSGRPVPPPLSGPPPMAAPLAPRAPRTPRPLLPPAPAPLHEPASHEWPSHESPSHEARLHKSPSHEATLHKSPSHEAPLHQSPLDEPPVGDADE